MSCWLATSVSPEPRKPINCTSVQGPILAEATLNFEKAGSNTITATAITTYRTIRMRA